MIFAIIIFSFAITVLAFTWFNINNQLSINYGNGDAIMQLQLQNLNQNLFYVGNPVVPVWLNSVQAGNSTSWQNVTIGLAPSFRQGRSNKAITVIDPNKLYAFMSMAGYNYPATKQSLGIGFDYYITIQSTSSVGSGINMSIGRNPASYGALTVDVSKRYALLSNIPVVVTTMIWTNSTLATS